MKLANMTLLLITSALACTTAVAEPTECRHGELIRTVDVIYQNPGQATPCEVLYDKPTESERATPWSAVNEAGYCEAKASELVERLNALGWTCQAAPAAAQESDA
jgi:hypothetical protein